MSTAEPPADPRQWPWKRYRVADLLTAECAPPRWAIPNLAVRGEVSILYGASGSGKSTLYQEAVVSHAMGRKFLGLFDYEEAQRFAIFDWENSPEQVVRSMRRLGLTEEASDDVQLLPLPPSSGVGLDSPKGRELIEWTARDFAATCLIFDHRDLAFQHTDELDGGAVTRTMAETKSMARRIDAAVLVLAHEPKAEHSRPMGRLRGHTAWAGLSDQVFHYRRTGRKNVLDHEKARGLTKSPPLDVTFLERGDPHIGPIQLEAVARASPTDLRDADGSNVERLLVRSGPMSWGELKKATGWGNDRLRNLLQASPRIVQPRRGLYAMRPN